MILRDLLDFGWGNIHRGTNIGTGEMGEDRVSWTKYDRYGVQLPLGVELELGLMHPKIDTVSQKERKIEKGQWELAKQNVLVMEGPYPLRDGIHYGLLLWIRGGV